MLERLYSLSENSTIDLIKGTFYHFDDTNPKKPNFQKTRLKIYENIMEKSLHLKSNLNLLTVIHQYGQEFIAENS